jgi:hypothetical protein
MSPQPGHPSVADWLAYWLGEGDAATVDALDEHLMHCEACGAQLDALIVLGAGVRDAFRAGLVATVAHGPFVQRLADLGLRVREYRLPLNGSVNCTVAPDDDLLVARLAAPLQGVERLDLQAELSTAPGEWRRLQDVPFDAAAGEVLYVPRLHEVRALPAHTMQVRLEAVGPEGAREIGRYRFHHRPWPGHPPGPN